MSEELKPCPFCGGKAMYHEFKGIYITFYSVRCKCGASRTGKTKDNTIMLWNRRVSDGIDSQSTAYDVDKVVEQLEELNKYKLDLADAMLDMQSNGLDRHFICLEEAIEIVKGGGIE